MLEAIARHVEQAPRQPALVAADGTTLDYGELGAAVATRAAAIASRHGRGGFVIVQPESTPAAVVDVLAVMASGNTVVPVATTTSAAQLDYIAAKCGGAPLLDAAAPLAGEVPVPAWRTPDPAMILFTSGTTGEPKGVIATAANLRHSCAAVAAYLDYADAGSAAVVLPLHYSYALVSQVLAMLTVGGAVHLFGTLRNPIKVARAITERAIAVFSGVPSTFAALRIVHGMQALEMPTVRVVCSAGAPFDLANHGTIKAIFPNATVFNNYGATEATPRIAWVSDLEPAFFDGSCGHAMAGVEMITVDPLTRRPQAEGETGVVAVRGPNVTPGYLNDADKTAASFIDGGFFVTNDVGTLRDGHLYVQGRADDIFDVGGEKVSPVEIEQALCSLPGVERSAVVGRRDPARGHVPIAFLKLSGEVRKAELASALSALVAPIKVPVRYYRVDAFPETPNGKLKRRELLANEAEYTRHEIS